jgi:hypothetical protein
MPGPGAKFVDERVSDVGRQPRGSATTLLRANLDLDSLAVFSRTGARVAVDVSKGVNPCQA